jgi:hypothetical protein
MVLYLKWKRMMIAPKKLNILAFTLWPRFLLALTPLNGGVVQPARTGCRQGD